MIGDGHNSVNAQDRSDNFRGKILRLDPDGTGAKGNPFGSRIWSYGHRNSYGFTFDPKTHRLWETENGPECTDEINLVAKGANFGWGPKESCSLAKPAGTEQLRPEAAAPPEALLPVDDRDHGVTRSVIGAGSDRSTASSSSATSTPAGSGRSTSTPRAPGSRRSRG